MKDSICCIRLRKTNTIIKKILLLDLRFCFMNYNSVFLSYDPVFHDKNVFLCNINYDFRSRSCIVHEQFFFSVVH